MSYRNQEIRSFSAIALARGIITVLIFSVLSLIGLNSSKVDLIPPIAIISPIIATVIEIIASFAWLHYRKRSTTFDCIQIAFDLTLINWIIYVTGITHSPFGFLYLLLVLFVTVYYSRESGIAVSLFSTASYFSLAYLSISGRIHLWDGSTVPYIPFGGIWLQGLGLFSGMILIAVFTSYLSRKLKQSVLLAEESRLNLARLQSKHATVFDDIPQPTITIDNQSRIITVNSAAKLLLRVSNQELIGADLCQVMSSPFSPLAELIDTPLDSKAEFEIEIDNEQHSIVTFIKVLTNYEGESIGKVIFLEDLTDLRRAQAEIIAHRQLAEALAEKEYKGLEEIGSHKPISKQIIGESKTIKQVFKLIERVAESPATVLVTGESGTGKELVARAIHALSTMREGPFVAVNCGAIPESLIESEFFGHVKGAFTGAENNHDGYFRQAHNGTIFLDEVGELPLAMQAKLLRVIQERSVRPIGAERDFDIDVRIISATHRNLREDVNQNRFREDLFYRLNVVSIPLPPLRDRREDIPLIINHILRKLTPEDQPLPVVDPKVVNLLINYRYPGNIRELYNLLERATVLGKQAILPEHLPDYVRQAKTTPPGMWNSNKSGQEIEAAGNSRPKIGKNNETKIYEIEDLRFPCNLDLVLEEIEKRYLQNALLESKGTKSKAAEMLGLNARSFRYRLQKYNLLS